MSQSPSTAPKIVVHELRTDTAPNNGYFPLDPRHVNEADGVIFLKEA